MKSVSFEVNLSGCPSACACCTELSEQTGPLLHATVPEMLQGSLKKALSPFSSVPARFYCRKAELWLYIPMSARCVAVLTTGVKSGLC